MDDLISRAAAIDGMGELIREYRENGEDNMADGVIIARRYVIKSLPAVAAVPVVHGRWIDYKDEHQCSACREFTIIDSYVWANIRYDFCPNCGAKMDGHEV